MIMYDEMILCTDIKLCDYGTLCDDLTLCDFVTMFDDVMLYDDVILYGVTFVIMWHCVIMFIKSLIQIYCFISKSSMRPQAGLFVVINIRRWQKSVIMSIPLDLLYCDCGCACHYYKMAEVCNFEHNVGLVVLWLWLSILGDGRSL